VPEISFGEISEEQIEAFLATPVGFEGKNISLKSKRCLNMCRAILEKPKLLLLFEDALDFGAGIGSNLALVSAKLPDCTMLVITKNQMNLGFFDKIIFIDGGKMIETGDPKHLIKNPQSYLHRYLREADELAFILLLEKVKAADALALTADNNPQLSEESLSWRSGSKKSSPQQSPLMSPMPLASSSPLRPSHLASVPSKRSSPAGLHPSSDHQVSHPRKLRALDSPDKLESIGEASRPRQEIKVSSSSNILNRVLSSGKVESESRLPSVIDRDVHPLLKLDLMNPHTMTRLNAAARDAITKHSHSHSHSTDRPLVRTNHFSPPIELKGDNSFGLQEGAQVSRSRNPTNSQDQVFIKEGVAPSIKPSREAKPRTPTSNKH
jgi:hypothetical protein